MKKIIYNAAFLITMALNASATELKNVAILEFEPKGAKKETTDIVRDILEVHLQRSGAFKVLERDQMHLILKEQEMQMSGCVESSCAVEIGRILSSDYVITGVLSKINSFILSIKIIDVKNNTITLYRFNQLVFHFTDYCYAHRYPGICLSQTEAG